MDVSYHYPPELLKLLIDTIPRLCRSKKDIIDFFSGVGISPHTLHSYELLLQNNKEEFRKYDVVREILVKINKDGESTLRERREVLNRVVNFDDFSVCWQNDEAAARGYVARIRELVNVKDSFTRINIERENERTQRIALEEKTANEKRKKNEQFENIKKNFFGLFNEDNPWQRGKKIEQVLNRYFEWSDILISESVTIKGKEKQGIVEQIDGVIRLREQPYLVEIKWEQETL
jgi:hypothetical protein